MDNLVKALMEKANLDEKAAEKVMDVVKDFIGDKLPAPIKQQVLNALDGTDKGDVLDGAKDVLGKFL